LLATSCALIGGLTGAAVVVWLRPEREPSVVVAASETRATTSADAPAEARVLRRLESVEQAVRALQARNSGTSQPAAPSAGSATEGAAASATATPAAPAVGDPVFEAAVLDVVERAEEDRDSQRDVRRSERARQQAEHWSQELTARLTLSPPQAAKLVEIRTQLAAELRERREAPGQFVPREQRRAEREALRERAEQKLREVLRPDQVARYDELDAELKIVRPRDAD
jgi:hypothetical protein